MPHYTWDLKRGPNLENYPLTGSLLAAAKGGVPIASLGIRLLVFHPALVPIPREAGESVRHRGFGFRALGLGFRV